MFCFDIGEAESLSEWVLNLLGRVIGSIRRFMATVSWMSVGRSSD